jgi:hypothetical protein
MRLISTLFMTVSVLAAATAARADVTISSAATSNMTCSNGFCQPTASKAVLNFSDLQNLLDAGNVTITTTGSGVQANNIDVTTTFGWTSKSGLTLDAWQSITFAAPVTDFGRGGVSLATNDGGSGGGLAFAIGSGQLTFASDANVLKINRHMYQLADSVRQLAAAIIANPGGHFALSRNANAQKDGPYYNPPIPVPFGGEFNGLGHAISNLEIADSSGNADGLFAILHRGSIASISLRNATVRGGATTGGLVGVNEGAVSNSFVGGFVHGDAAGGLIGQNTGTLTTSQSDASVEATESAGGVVGGNSGTISLSFATGDVSGTFAGGLLGYESTNATIENSYSLGNVVGGRGRNGSVGGFVGVNLASISSSYSTGSANLKKRKAEVGGFDGTNSGEFSDCYWDTDTSGTEQGGGGGSQTGLTGLTTAEFQSGLPAGFDPSIWGEVAYFNNGLPYLLANPPL